MRMKLEKDGDTRIIKKFLLLPEEAGDERRWLEFVKIKQKFVVWDLRHPGDWENMVFIDD